MLPLFFFPTDFDCSSFASLSSIILTSAVSHSLRKRRPGLFQFRLQLHAESSVVKGIRKSMPETHSQGLLVVYQVTLKLLHQF